MWTHGKVSASMCFPQLQSFPHTLGHAFIFPSFSPGPCRVSSPGFPLSPSGSTGWSHPSSCLLPWQPVPALSVTLTLLGMAYPTGVSAPGLLAYSRAESLLCSPNVGILHEMHEQMARICRRMEKVWFVCNPEYNSETKVSTV